MSQKGEKKQKEESFAKCFEYDKQQEGRGSQTRGRERGGVGAAATTGQWNSLGVAASSSGPGRAESSRAVAALAPSTAFQFWVDSSPASLSTAQPPPLPFFFLCHSMARSLSLFHCLSLSCCLLCTPFCSTSLSPGTSFASFGLSPPHASPSF